MGKKIKMHLILCLGFFMAFACKKTEEVKEIEKPVVTEPTKPTQPPKDTTTTVPPANAIVLEYGTGSGNLSIDASTLKIPTNSIIKIKGGSYSSIRISNFLHETGTVQIQNDGLVELVGDRVLTFSNVKNVIFTGSGTKEIDKGFVFRDKNSDQTCVQLSNNIDNFTFKDVKFTNVKTYNAIQYDSQKVYNGSESSYSKNIKFSNIECDNTGTLIRFNGTAENGAIVGLVKNIEISYVTFKNSPKVGTIVALGNVQGYDVHNNTVQNINQSNDNHNGIFYIQGNGKFYNNIIKDHQGNALRGWVYSIGTTPQTTLIFNNIVINSRQYGAFELQAFDRNMMSGSTTYSNAMVFNNTCGSLLPKDMFPAQVLDLYSLKGGKCEVFNNVGYNFPLVGDHNTNFIWNELNDTRPTAYSNKYFTTYKSAGIVDEVNFNLSSASTLKNSGSTLNGRNLETLTNQASTKDFYGKQRSLSNPSIGAVE